MPNIKNVDCGFNPDDFRKFQIVKADNLKNPEDFDLTPYR